MFLQLWFLLLIYMLPAIISAPWSYRLWHKHLIIIISLCDECVDVMKWCPLFYISLISKTISSILFIQVLQAAVYSQQQQVCDLLTCGCPSLSVHYNDVIMGAIASQITSLTIVYSIVYSDADQRKHQSSASLAFVRGIHRDRWIHRTNGQ